jgi:hypothetical protein
MTLLNSTQGINGCWLEVTGVHAKPSIYVPTVTVHTLNGTQLKGNTVKHKQPCYTHRISFDKNKHRHPMYCCSVWDELDAITQAEHKLAHTQEWQDYKDHLGELEKAKEEIPELLRIISENELESMIDDMLDTGK